MLEKDLTSVTKFDTIDALKPTHSNIYEVSRQKRVPNIFAVGCCFSISSVPDQ